MCPHGAGERYRVTEFQNGVVSYAKHGQYGRKKPWIGKEYAAGKGRMLVAVTCCYSTATSTEPSRIYFLAGAIGSIFGEVDGEPPQFQRTAALCGFESQVDATSGGSCRIVASPGQFWGG